MLGVALKGSDVSGRQSEGSGTCLWSVYGLQGCLGAVAYTGAQGFLVPLRDRVLLSSPAQLSIGQCEDSENALASHFQGSSEPLPTSALVLKAFHEI